MAVERTNLARSETQSGGGGVVGWGGHGLRVVEVSKRGLVLYSRSALGDGVGRSRGY